MAQQSSAYLKRLSDSTIRMFLDEKYYLAQENCEFKARERVAGFDFKTNKFHGPFKEFNLNGRMVLTGNYIAGEKDGLFTAFHGNGNKKWTVQFSKDVPIGDWTYYYPDELPMLIMKYDSTGGVRVDSYWDTKRKKLVDNGKGTFSMIYPFQGFSEYGYPSYNRRGKIVNGVPEGYWPIYFLDHKNSATLAAEEYFKEGAFQGGLNLFTDGSYTLSPFSFSPVDNFVRAEQFISKDCNFDEFSNFNQYLMQKFEQILSNYNLKSLMNQPISYQISVSKKGVPKSLIFTRPLDQPKVQEVLERGINMIPFYYPTWKDGQEIDDTLQVVADLQVNELGKAQFYNLKIQRNNSK